MDKRMLKKWRVSGYMEQRILYPTEAGTPQGGIVSPVLANMTLDGLERVLSELFRPTTVAGRRAKVHLIRYADDFVITSSSRELLEQEVKPAVEAFLRERGLTLSQEKTRITHIEDGFDFLGQHVRKYKTGKRHKLLITPSKKNVKAFLEKIRGIVKANQAISAGKLIAKLNPVIRGWVNYHRHVVSKEIFSSVDARDLSDHQEMGQAKTPMEIQCLGGEEIFHLHRRKQLGLLWNSGRAPTVSHQRG